MTQATAWCDECKAIRPLIDEDGDLVCEHCGYAPIGGWGATPEPGHVYTCCGKVGRISAHNPGCPVYAAMVARDEAEPSA
jgi:hypothetical protein